MASIDNGSRIHQTYGLPKAVRRVEIWYRYCAFDGIVARVEPVGCLRDRADVDVGRQLVVDFLSERFGREVGIQLEVRDLRDRVHAGIGSARSVQLELAPSRRFADRALDLARDRPRVLLHLPAAVARARVLNR